MPQELPQNEPVLPYKEGDEQRNAVQKELYSIESSTIDISMKIDGENVDSSSKIDIISPHNHSTVIARASYGGGIEVYQAIEAAQNAKNDWANASLEERSKVFLKAADLLAGEFRARMNAATMAGQSKNIHQAEIDAACELIDFFRFNVGFAKMIEQHQPISIEGIVNSSDYRPLEGFVLAVTPFNFTSIAANLPCAPALMGNTVVWKPTETQIYSAMVTMEILEKAGLPDGVINMIFTPGPETGEICTLHPELGGIHFTGSTGVFKSIWKGVSDNLDNYRSFPRVVGETGGKDFVIAHESADVKSLGVALLRGAFEYQGQKCSAASRAYVPESMWPELKEQLAQGVSEMKMGTPSDFSNFINAVIDEKAFDKISEYIYDAKNCHTCEIVAGGNYDKSEGYFIEPTIIKTEDPFYRSMVEEIFGPVLTIFVYPNDEFEHVLTIADETSPYALTGSIFSGDEDIVDIVSQRLRNSAGNFYINDKPTGAVVGQQPFGGARMSGTNDKAGAMWNLMRWTSPRTIKRNLNPPTDWRYPFLGG